MSAWTKEQQGQAITELRELLKPGDKIYTIVTHVSRSGMLRSIRALTLSGGDRRDISYLIARVLDERIDNINEGLKVSGCGMDMGFDVVYRLGYALYPEGYQCIGEKCPSSDHVNGDSDYTPHLHKSGGYALRQSWL